MQDYRILFEELAKFLSSSGFALVTEQVREELATGRLVEERLSTLAEVSRGPDRVNLFDADYQKGVSADFVRRAEYSDREAVILLIEAARRATCESAMMADEIRIQLKGEGLSGISFVADIEGQQPVELRFEHDSNSEMHKEIATKLNALAKRVLTE